MFALTFGKPFFLLSCFLGLANYREAWGLDYDFFTMGERVGLLFMVYFLTVNTDGLGLGLTGASLCELMLDMARTGDLKLN